MTFPDNLLILDNKDKNMKIPTVKELRQKGYKIRVTHYRYSTAYENKLNLFSLYELRTYHDDWQKYIKPKGGETKVEILTPDGKEFAASAVCSKKDVFCRRIGRETAILRILLENNSVYNVKQKKEKPKLLDGKMVDNNEIPF